MQPTTKRSILQAALILALALAAALAGDHWAERRAPRLRASKSLRPKPLNEISGLLYLEASKTLLTVSDDGTIAEVSVAGEVLRERRHKGHDFEDVTQSTDGSIIVIEEAKGSIQRVDLGDFSLAPIATVAHPAGHDAPKNRGFEGILATADGNFVLACEMHPSSLVFVDRTGRELRIVATGAPSLTAVLSAGPELFMVLSRTRGIGFLDHDGRMRGDWIALNDDRVEGAAFVPGRGLILAVDEVPARLLVFKDIRSMDDLIALADARKR